MPGRSWHRPRVPVLPGDTEEALAARVLAEEHRIYPEALAALATRIRLPEAGAKP